MALPHAQLLDTVDVSPLGDQLAEARSTSLIKTSRVQLLHLVFDERQDQPTHHVADESIVHCLEGRVELVYPGGVRALTADNPAQSARWTQLRAVIDERLGLSRRIEALRRSEGLDAANAFVAVAPLRETRERVDRILGEVEGDALGFQQRDILLDQRKRDLTRTLDGDAVGDRAQRQVVAFGHLATGPQLGAHRRQLGVQARELGVGDSVGRRRVRNPGCVGAGHRPQHRGRGAKPE